MSRSRYKFLRVHAQGGLGRIWIAHDEDLGRDVALKEICPKRAQDDRTQALFHTEAQITGRLEHPNIVPVYELSRPQGRDQLYYTMRFLRGRTLSDTITEHHRQKETGTDTPRGFRKLLEAFVGVCNAIAYAHSRGIIHLDLKPANVMLGQFGEVIVLDWGLAKVVGRDHSAAPDDHPPLGVHDLASEMTCTFMGPIMGTPAYMSPEQATDRRDLIGPASDVYGLGAVLFEILTGEPPGTVRITRAESSLPVVVVTRRLARRLSSTHGVPRALRAVCLRAMAPSPADRYAKVSDLLDDIQAWLADEPVSAYRPSAAERSLRWVRHHRTLTTVATVISAALIAFGVNLFRLSLLERQDQLTSALCREFETGGELLRALQSYYSVDDAVSREEFRTYVAPYLARRGELQALEWIPAVEHSARTAYEQACVAAGFADCSFKERSSTGQLVRASEREVYYPAYYVEPYRGNEQALGYDLGSSSDRRTALELAIERNTVVAACPIDLVQASGHSFGMLAFSPVLRETRDEGKRNCLGLVLGVYRIDRLLEAAWADVSTAHLEVKVYDVTVPARPVLLWSNMDEPEILGPVDDVDLGCALPFGSVSTQIDTWGRTWQIVTKAKLSFLIFYPHSR